MKTSEAIAFYGGNVSALARALGIDQSTIYSWREYPPVGRQYQIQSLTGSVLKAEPQAPKGKRGPSNHPGERSTDRKGD